MSVYLDLVMGLNFLVDFLLILGTNRLLGFPPGVKQAVFSALLGAIYSGACLLPGLRFLGNGLWRMVFLVLMCACAFGCNRSAVKRGGIFLLLSMSMGGMGLMIGNGSVPMLILAALGIWLICRIGFGNGIGQEYVPVEIRHNGVHMKLLALKDTGNTLRDPISGESVLILSADAALQISGLSREQLMHPMETMLERPGFRLIPYYAVGQTGGMMLGMKLDQVTIGNYRGSAIVAFAPDQIGRGDGYQALTGGVI